MINALYKFNINLKLIITSLMVNFIEDKVKMS